jgi:hypothetical protein
MTRSQPPDPYVEAKLFGVLLAGVFGQTRADCSAHSRLRQELRQSGVHTITLPKPKPPKPPKP